MVVWDYGGGGGGGGGGVCVCMCVCVCVCVRGYGEIIEGVAKNFRDLCRGI